MGKQTKQIKKLEKRIEELKYFIHTINTTETYKTTLKIITIIDNITQVKLFGTRKFKTGTRESIIEVPKEIIPEILEIAIKQLEENKKELSNLLK